MSEKDFEKNMENVEEDNIIQMTDEDGNEVAFECLMTFDYKDAVYAALLPVKPMEGFEEGEVLIMRIEENGEESSFSPIETEEELDEVWNAFIEIYDEDEDSDDEEDDEDECGCEDGCECGCGCGCDDEEEEE
jgi:uncharacterized protein YrzB (UPF0473 family)